MCTDLIAECPRCMLTRHVYWKWCSEYLKVLGASIQGLVEPLPRPAQCPELGELVIMEIRTLACPAKSCINSPQARRERSDLNAAKAARLEKIRRQQRAEEARREAFAAKYFSSKRPVNPSNKDGVLAEGVMLDACFGSPHV